LRLFLFGEKEKVAQKEKLKKIKSTQQNSYTVSQVSLFRHLFLFV